MASKSTGLSGIAARYANALYELAEEQNTLDDVAGDLRDMKAMLDASDDLARLVRSPLINRQAQAAAMAAVVAEAGMGDIIRRSHAGAVFSTM